MPGLTSGSTVLVGRAAELAVLRGGLQAALSGQAQVVVVDGPAGIGKTALLTEFVTRETAAAEVVWLRCDRFERDLPFAAAELLLGAQIAATSSELEVGRSLLVRLGDSHPAQDVTVLVVDDAHWMDGPSARALRFALRRLQVEPFLAVVARRPSELPADLFVAEDPRASTVVQLGPLDAAAVRDLARGVRGWTLDGPTADRVVEQTGGSPLLISSVLQNVARHEQLETWTDVPATAATAAQRMLGSLDQESRRLVEAAAVLAEPADLVMLGGVAEVTAAAPRAHAAAAAGLLAMDSAGAVAATHTLLGEAVYDLLPLGRRQHLHARAAEWTSGDRRLGHRAAAVSRPDPRLVAELVTAADRARSSRRYDLAAAHRLRARSVSADPMQRDTLLCEALIDRVSAQDLDGADALAQLAEPLTPSPLRSLALGLLARERGRIGPARTYLQEALKHAPEPSNLEVRPRAAVALAVLHVRLSESELALTALDAVDHLDEPELAGDAATARGIALWQAGDDRAALSYLASVPVSPEGSPWEAELLAVRGMVHLFAGELPKASGDLNASIGLTHLWRPSTNQPRIYVMRSMARFRLGDWDGALADAAAARALAVQAEVWSVVWARAVSIDVPASRGQWDIAAAHLAEARIALGRLPYAQVVDVVARHESAIHVARGDYSALLALLEPLRTGHHMEQLAAFRPHRWILPTWISSAIHAGRLVEAERELDRYTGMLERWPGGVEPARLGWLRGLLAQAHGQPETARRHFHADLADVKTPKDPFTHGQLRHTMGRFEQAAGRRREAINHLTVAHDLFTQLRAAPFIERCRLDLTAAGRRPVGTNPRALTEREEDVVALVSRGFTNKEVARELFLSAKTVEYHLRGVYSKLGIASRTELRRLRGSGRLPSQGHAGTTERQEPT